MSEKIIIACRDEDYLMMLAEKFYAELDDRIQITAISVSDYLISYMNQGNIEERILIVEQELYAESMDTPQFDSIVLLDEKEEMMNVINHKFSVIHPFLKLDAIYDFIVSQTSLQDIQSQVKKKDTRLIAVYSPIGGSGKTTVSYGLCMAFAKAYKKVLYINPSPLQDFGFLFQNANPLEPRLERMIAKQDSEVAAAILGAVQNYGFDFLPPVRMSFATLGISLKDYIYVITELKRINQYDYIVIDMGSELNIEMAQVIGQADRVICIGLQDEYSAFRMKRFLDNIDASDASRFLFVCNKYRPEAKDYMNKGTGEAGTLNVKEYITYMSDLVRADQLTEPIKRILEEISIYCI